VPELKSEGYDVYYQEFDDGHTVPVSIVANGFAWFMGIMDEGTQT
jgi:predicted esterase